MFGTSGGAQIGLNLAARYPDLVAVLVAHEPPAIMLLDDPSAALAADTEIHDTYRREGVDAAMQRFFAMNGLEDDEESRGRRRRRRPSRRRPRRRPPSNG